MRRIDYMRKIVLLCGLLLALSLPAMAQDLPRFDAFGGYSYVRVSIPTSGTSGNITSNLNGGSGAVAFYPSRWWGVVGDFGGYKLGDLKQGSTTLPVDGSVVTYLFGPRIRFGAEAFTPFAQVLFGGAHIGDVTTSDSAFCSPASPPCSVISSDSAFAMTVGGGVDIKVARHFAIRGQAEYLMTKFQDGVNDRQNNARISVGIVIH